MQDNCDRVASAPYTDAGGYDHESTGEDGPFPSASIPTAYHESLGYSYDIEAQPWAPPRYSGPTSLANTSEKPTSLLHPSMEHSANSPNAIIEHLLHVSRHAPTLRERLAAIEAISRAPHEQNQAKQATDRICKEEERREIGGLVRYGVRWLAEALFELLLHFVTFFTVALVVVFVVALIFTAGMSFVGHGAAYQDTMRAVTNAFEAAR